MFRLLSALTVVAALSAPALADHRPRWSVQLQWQGSVRDDRSDLAQLQFLRQRIQQTQRYFTTPALRRLDARALRLMGAGIGETRRELARAERFEGRYYDDYSPYARQPVAGRDSGADHLRQVLAERQRLALEYRSLAGQPAQPFLIDRRLAIIDRLIRLESFELRHDVPPPVDPYYP